MQLTEILLVLSLLAIAATMAVPRAGHGLDAIKVRNARETAFGLASQTRAVALGRGGAQLIFDLEKERARVTDAAGAVIAEAAFPDCDVDAAESPATVVLTYDAHGLGRMTSRTIRFRRGKAAAGLTFSAYGRVRRW